VERQSRTNYSVPQWGWAFEAAPLLDLVEVALVGVEEVVGFFLGSDGGTILGLDLRGAAQPGNNPGA